VDGVGWVWMTFPFQPISYLTITYVVYDIRSYPLSYQ
jgi:hypothetical protein